MNVILLVISTLLILLFLIRESKTEGFLDSGEVYKNIKERGPGKIIFITSGVLGIIFMILCVL